LFTAHSVALFSLLSRVDTVNKTLFSIHSLILDLALRTACCDYT